ncbi:MAG: DUF3828 domain-containing protein [Phaeodactylibacter sp.]|nr:DUF3828 domain-containing protein [Phaeodactylibacter sp.]
MKYILIFFLATFALASCKNSNPAGQKDQVPTDNGGSQDDPDLVAINECIHSFYAWYEANGSALEADFVKYAKHATLDAAKLASYFSVLKKSGYISQAYIDNETADLKNLEATAWKNIEDGPLPGLDYDRFTCSQDMPDWAFWKTAPIAADGLGTDKSMATMSGMEGGSERTQKFEMVKENGKWLIAKILCGTGE